MLITIITWPFAALGVWSHKNHFQDANKLNYIAVVGFFLLQFHSYDQLIDMMPPASCHQWCFSAVLLVRCRLGLVTKPDNDGLTWATVSYCELLWHGRGSADVVTGQCDAGNASFVHHTKWGLCAVVSSWSLVAVPWPLAPGRKCIPETLWVSAVVTELLGVGS